MSTRAFSRYVDGYFGSPRRISRTPREYPFRLNGDVITCIYLATYLVDQGKFAPTASGTVDPESAGMYLLAESKPEIVNGDLATFGRVYGNVPSDQVTYGTQVITKPPFPTNDYLGYWVDSLLNTTLANVWSVAIAATTVGTRVITGGTFTVTYKTSTTGALAYNETGANIATAINALADLVTDSTTVSVTNGINSNGLLSINRATGVGSMTDMSVTITSLTPAAVQSSTKISTQAAIYIAPAVINVYKVAHGLTTGVNVRYSTLSTGGGTQAAVTRIDADNFTVPTVTPSSPPNPSYYRTLVRTYTPGTDRVGVRRTQKFYLAGVTSGITTPADIPVPATLINEADLLAAVVANATGYQDYDATELGRYQDSAIHTQTLTAIDMADL